MYVYEGNEYVYEYVCVCVWPTARKRKGKILILFDFLIKQFTAYGFDRISLLFFFFRFLKTKAFDCHFSFEKKLNCVLELVEAITCCLDKEKNHVNWIIANLT